MNYPNLSFHFKPVRTVRQYIRDSLPGYEHRQLARQAQKARAVVKYIPPVQLELFERPKWQKKKTESNTPSSRQ